MRTHRMDIPIYFGFLNIIVAKDELDMIEVGKKYHPEEDLSKYGAFVWQRYNKRGVSEYFICVKENVSNHLLAHEIVHLVNALFLHIGCELDRRNDEPQAYLTGWFFEQIEIFLQKTTIKQ